MSSDEIEALQERIQKYRDRLSGYLYQVAIVGEAHAKPETTAGIREARAGIRRCKERLRDLGAAVADHSDDEPAQRGDESAGSAAQARLKPTAAQRPDSAFNFQGGDFRGAIVNVASDLQHVSQRIDAVSAAAHGPREHIVSLLDQLSAALQPLAPAYRDEVEAAAAFSAAISQQVRGARPNRILMRAGLTGLQGALAGLDTAAPDVAALVAQIAALAEQVVA